MSSNMGKTKADSTDPEEDGQIFTSKKRKSTLIDGVSTASLVSLQAQLFQAQQQADSTNRRPKHSTSSRRLRLNDANTKRNKGVESRIAKDLATQTPLSTQDRLLQSQTALERKSKLYDELSKGKYQGRDDDGILEQYQVDFLMKQSDPITHNNNGTDNEVNKTHTNQAFASNAPHFVASTRTYTQEQASSRTMSSHHNDDDERVEKIETLRKIADETDRERKRIEMKRKEQEDADEKKKEELKRAYLKKQLVQKMGKGGMKQQ